MAGLAVGRDEEGFYKLTGYWDPVAYQAIGSSIIVISMLIVSSIGQYINSASLSGRLEMLLASPARLSVVLISTSIPMMIFGLVVFTLTTAPLMYVATHTHGPYVAIISTAVLSIGMIPLFIMAVLVGLVIARIRSPILLNLVQALVFTFSGALYPLTILPEILRIFSQALPIVYIVDPMRSLLITGDLGIIGLKIPALLIIALAYGSIGAILYRRFSSALRRGGLNV